MILHCKRAASDSFVINFTSFRTFRKHPGWAMTTDKQMTTRNYRIVASSNTSHLEAHPDIYRLLMKEIFDAYELWTYDKKLISWLVSHVRTFNFTVSSLKKSQRCKKDKMNLGNFRALFGTVIHLATMQNQSYTSLSTINLLRHLSIVIWADKKWAGFW